MYWLLEAFENIQIFMERGGDVLYGILIVTLVMWLLIIERFWYFRATFASQKRQIVDTWEARSSANPGMPTKSAWP